MLRAQACVFCGGAIPFEERSRKYCRPSCWTLAYRRRRAGAPTWQGQASGLTQPSWCPNLSISTGCAKTEMSRGSVAWTKVSQFRSASISKKKQKLPVINLFENLIFQSELNFELIQQPSPISSFLSNYAQLN